MGLCSSKEARGKSSDESLGLLEAEEVVEDGGEHVGETEAALKFPSLSSLAAKVLVVSGGEVASPMDEEEASEGGGGSAAAGAAAPTMALANTGSLGILASAPLLEGDIVKERKYLQERQQAFSDALLILQKEFIDEKNLEKRAALYLLFWKCAQELKIINNRIESLQVEIGMTFRDRITMQEMARLNNVCIVCRPIHIESGAKLKDGAAGKKIFTKAKSSPFGPISGFLPLNVGLSKLCAEPDRLPLAGEKVWNALHMFDQDLKVADLDLGESAELLKKAREIFAELSEHVGVILTPEQSLKLMHLNEIPPQVSIPKVYKDKSGEYRVLYLAKKASAAADAAGVGPDLDIAEVYFADEDVRRPIFGIQRDDGFYMYNYLTHKYDQKLDELPAETEARPVNILAYKHFYLDAEGKLQVEHLPITSDYDIFDAEPYNIPPMFVDAQLPPSSSLDLLALREDPMRLDQYVEEQWLEYERARVAHARDVGNYGSMGIVSDAQRDVIASLRKATRASVNHGFEIHNVFPETIEGDHVAFLPDGKIVILDTKDKVLRFINEQRRLGCSLSINPKSSLHLGRDGQLCWDDYDWEPLNAALRFVMHRHQDISRRYLESGYPAEFFTKPSSDDLDALEIVGGQEGDQAVDRIYLAGYTLVTEIIDGLAAVERLLLEAELRYVGIFDSLLHLHRFDRERGMHIEAIKTCLKEHPELLDGAFVSGDSDDEVVEVMSYIDQCDGVTRRIEDALLLTDRYKSCAKYAESARVQLIADARERARDMIGVLEEKIAEFEGYPLVRLGGAWHDMGHIALDVRRRIDQQKAMLREDCSVVHDVDGAAGGPATLVAGHWKGRRGAPAQVAAAEAHVHSIFRG